MFYSVQKTPLEVNAKFGIQLHAACQIMQKASSIPSLSAVRVNECTENCLAVGDRAVAVTHE